MLLRFSRRFGGGRSHRGSAKKQYTGEIGTANNQWQVIVDQAGPQLDPTCLSKRAGLAPFIH